MAWVYILKAKNGKYYIGSTNNLKRRFWQHKHKHTYTTKRLIPERIIFSQEYVTLREARIIELKIKKLKRKDYIEKIIRDGFIKINM